MHETDQSLIKQFKWILDNYYNTISIIVIKKKLLNLLCLESKIIQILKRVCKYLNLSY